MRRAGMLETRRLLAFEMGCEMTSARRSKSLAAALFAAALTLAVTVATATAFAEASPQDNAAGPAFAPGTMTAADGEETIDSDCVPGDKLDGVKVRFRPAGSHKPVSVEDDGDGDQEDLILYYLGESTHFRLEKADGDSYKIRFFQDYANQDVKRKKAQILDVERNNNDDQTYYREGQNIHMVSGDGDALNKRWQFLQQPDGTYYIRNKRTQLYWSLEDLNKPKSNNNKIVQRKTPMKWELELVSTSDFSVDKMAEIKHYDSLNFALGGETVTSLDWMSFLPDSAYITDISIPGTHDAAMARLDTSAGKESRRTQQYYIDEMLAAGVRHFDTRLGLENGTITLVHSSDADALDHDGNDLTFATLLSWVSGFLDKHPDETVIMQIMADEKESEVERAALAWINNFIRNDEEGDLIWVGDHVPTLGEVRGKVVIVSRFNNVVKEDSSDFYIPGRGYWALDVGGWRQSDTYPVYEDYPLSPTIHSSAQPYQSLDRWDDCEVWVQDSYSHTPHETTFKSSKKPYIVGSIDGIVYDYFDLPETFLGKKGYPEGTYGTEYRRAEALKKGKHAWVFNFLNCSANGLGYHYRGNAKEIHQWIYDNDWIIRDDMFTGVVGIDYVDELMANKVYRTNFAGGTGGWGDTTYEWSADNTTCTASRTWTGGAGFVETETATAKRTVKAATCTEPGSTEYVAEFENKDFALQAKKFEGAPALGHRWDEGVITKRPTCTEAGTKVYTCENDSDHTKNEVVPATGHTPAAAVHENEVAATLEADGHYDSVVYCQTCRTELSRQTVTVPYVECAHEHKKTLEVTLTPANCILPRMYAVIEQCEDCKQVLSSQVYREESALGHDWGEADYTWANDHSKVTASHDCSRCKLEESETVVPVVTGRSATCTDAGITVYTATFADKSFGIAGVVADTVHIEPLGHNWDAGVITKKRTCAEDGVRTYTCKRCGTTRTEALPATGHSPAEPVIENEVSATCVKAGSFDEVVYCMSCDEKLSRTAKTLPIDPNAHEWAVLDGCDADGWKASQVGDMITERRECKNDPSHFETRTFEVDHVHDYRLVPVQPASCTHAGVKEHDVCATCGHVFRVNDEGIREETTLAALAIPAAHTPGEPEREDVSAPTCAEPGEYDMVVRCEDCGAELSREHVAIEPLGHDWGAAAYEWSDDLGSCTATRTCNRGEPHVQVAPGSVTFEMTKEPSATEPGERTYTATFDVDWAQTQTATSGIPPTGEDAIAYQATKGGGAWTKGSGDKLSFTYQRSQQNDLTFSLFTGVLVDGQEVPQGSYDAYSGSVVIELSPNYLETLAVGAHTLQPTFQDGVGDEVSFTIAEAVKPEEGGEVKPDEGGSMKPDDKGGSKVDGNGNGDGGSSGGTAASTKPASSTSKGSAASAKTGDALPIAAVCILVVLGLVVAIVAYRKSRK